MYGIVQKSCVTIFRAQGVLPEGGGFEPYLGGVESLKLAHHNTMHLAVWQNGYGS